MVENVEKCKNKLKRKLDWSSVVFHLHRFDISGDLEKFKKDHPDMARSRAAYNVLKHYYSTTFLRGFKRLYYDKDFVLDYDLEHCVEYYFVKLRKPGVLWL